MNWKSEFLRAYTWRRLRATEVGFLIHQFTPCILAKHAYVSLFPDCVVLELKSCAPVCPLLLFPVQRIHNVSECIIESTRCDH